MVLVRARVSISKQLAFRSCDVLVRARVSFSKPLGAVMVLVRLVC